MRALVLVGLCSCWTGSAKPATQPEVASTDPAFGGQAYGQPEETGFASLTGTADIGSGLDDADVYGGLIGSDPCGGQWGTIGHGSGTGSGGSGAGLKTTIGQPQSTGDLDKAIIRRYMKRNIQKIQACYEAELVADPQLAGTVTVKFTIGADGKVVSATGHGMPTVETCVARAVSTIWFPKPKGNGVVVVSYPFIFRSAP